MKPVAGASKARPRSKRPAPARSKKARIHPVLIYPFKQPDDYVDLEALYDLVARLDGDRSRYARPITVLDRKTHYRNEPQPRFVAFRNKMVARHSDILDAWCVDTCQMWYCGLGAAFETGREEDVYWLIPGDFNYASGTGQEVLSRLADLPGIIEELQQDFCVGEIATGHSHPKQLIDTYGTFALLYNWFPVEAKEIRQITERPRSEFFAIRHGFLGEVLRQRWYAYEQTVAILLQAAFLRRRISRFFVGDITDLPESGGFLTSAVQQVERTERLLKSVWRERNESAKDWPERYSALEIQSGQICRTAFRILHDLLCR
jgi:hypothetical protein